MWGLLAIPIMLLLHALFSRRPGSTALLERFVDPHLLTHLIRNRNAPARKSWAPLLLWAAAWLCGTVAMAGPRWGYTDQQTFRASQNLVIVLDLSQTMNAQDVKPSRVARARQEIQNVLDMRRGEQIGLVAYAAVPHLVAPLTDDIRTIRNLLPALDTSLVTLQGDRLGPALAMAAAMLKAEPGDRKSILVISDGGFEEDDIAGLIRAAGGAAIYAMGIGTTAGAPIPGGDGGWLKLANGQDAISHLQDRRLQMLAAAGHGFYVEANYSDDDTRAILGRVEALNGKAQAGQDTVRVWDERFYIPAFLLGLLILPWFRKGAGFLAMILLASVFLAGGQANAATPAELFRNQDQQAKAAYDQGNYKAAMAKFHTTYRRGVAAYRAHAYAQAAALFKASLAQKGGDLNALYNLGNAQLMQYQPENAIRSYEEVLKQRPDDAPALHNLAIAREMLAHPPDKKQKKKESDQKKDQDKRGGKGAPDKQQQKQSAKNQQANQQKSGSPQNGAGKAPQARQAGSENTPPQTAQGTAASRAVAQGNQQKGTARGVPVRVQRDINADQWLRRVQSDPGSFLKNQFMIEDAEHGSR
ncbi:MAG: von Willebrand factor type A-like protein [Alphaproteobacteria bacterium]|nr:von Willebrand factor type A-like protein [Alphaproteobacteria bacterium]